MFPERCDRGAISYLERERVPKNWSIVTENIRKVFERFMNFTVESDGVKEFKFEGTSPCISGRSGGMNFVCIGVYFK